MAERNVVGIVDAGGRGHALARAYERSPHVDEIVVIPGNDMIRAMAQKPTRVFPEIKLTDALSITEKFQEVGVTLADVAQDNALEAGVSNSLRDAGINTIGPSRNAAQIEWSKSFARKFGDVAGVKQPGWAAFTRPETALKYIDLHEGEGFAIKADGLAEGKGVIVAKNHEEARHAISEIQKLHPKAAATFLVEELASGEEFSTFFASDGEHVKLFGHAQDYKRAYNHDEGENTGGMGCSTPPRHMRPHIELRVTNEIEKMMTQLNFEKTPYQGIGYYGGMLDEALRVVNNIEWNARWGDPEVQCIAPGITSDMYELAMSIVEKHLDQYALTTDNLARVVVAGASRGYPRDYSAVKGKEIFGLDEVIKMDGVEVYGAGVKVKDGKYYANGGRLFYIVGVGENVVDARDKAYAGMANVHIEGNNLMYRIDIGWRDVDRLRKAGY